MVRETDQVQIISETKDFLLVYKPAGLAVESRSLTEPDLGKKLKNRKAGYDTLFVINRLDQVVEGLVLFARTKKAAANLSAQLQAHRMEKEYLAAVDGVPAKKEETLRDALLRDGRTNTSRVVPFGTAGAKEARLSYTCLFSSAERSLLHIRLYTGRHHQIRLQLANAGLPIRGDRKYSPNPEKAGAACRFPALCCCALSFEDPSGKKRLRFQIVPKGEGFSEYLTSGCTLFPQNRTDPGFPDASRRPE